MDADDEPGSPTMANQIQIGQEVAVKSGFSPNNFSFGYTVSKITPGGQVVVKRADGYETRFDAEGYEMNKLHGSRYNRARLVVDLDAAREAVRKAKAQSEAASLINAVRVEARHTYPKETLQEQIATLATLLEAARAAVEAI